MIEQEIRSKIEAFVADKTASYDASHNLAHAKRVEANVQKITSYDSLSETDALILHSAAMLHDVLDHKYVSDEEAKNRAENITSLLSPTLSSDDIKTVFDIIANMSFSKEKSGKTKHIGERQHLRDIVSDADKLDALGELGLQRCFDYARATNAGASEEAIYQQVVDHCHDKLLHLIDYMHTSESKNLAREEMKVIEAFVRKTVTHE